MTKDEVIKYFKDNELDIQRANVALLICDFVYAAYAEAYKIIGTIYSPIFVYLWSRNMHAHTQIIPKDVMIKAEMDIYDKYIKNPASLDEIMQNHLALEKEIDKVWEEYKGLSSKSGGKFLSIYKKFVEVSREWWAYAAIFDSKGLILTSLLVPKFAKRHGLSDHEAAEIFATLSHPETPTILNDERKLYLQICIDIFSHIDHIQKIEKYLQDFFWIKSNFYRAVHLSPKNLKELALKDISERGIETINRELEDIDNSFKGIHVQKSKLRKSMKLTEEDEMDIKFAEKVILWVDRRKFGMMRDFYYQLFIMEDVAKELRISYEDITLYTVEEFEKLLKEDERLDAKEIEKRSGGVLLNWQKGEKCKIFYDAEAKEIYEAAINYPHQDEVKGHVASTGSKKTITGKVRIIFKPEIEDLELGEILVTSMTRVEYVPLMRKAKAIVTDEGGIACHAAIVSRELGIPAIIGTKNATRVLKNGDEIEMDLEKGIVRKI